MTNPTAKRSFRPLFSLLFLLLVSAPTAPALAQDGAKGNGDGRTLPGKVPIVFHVEAPNQQLQMTVNTSRILKLGQKMNQAQVNNPDLLDLALLSPSEIQVTAKAAGVTQVNLWGEDKQIYTIDVIVVGDARELDILLRTQFPTASLRVIPVKDSIMISGYVDKNEQVNLIVLLAEQYYPKVINAITVSGVQQVLLHVKVMEVSRTKLRALGFDFAKLTGNNMIYSGISGLLQWTTEEGVIEYTRGASETFDFLVVDSNSSFFGVLEALREDKLMKILAEPTVVAVNGRPASFVVGGETPVPVPQSLGTISIEYKKFGTQVDFVPIVLGDGRIRLDVKPRVSEIDNSVGLTLNDITVPGFRVREVNTEVELQAGQTLAIAGLIQSRDESVFRGLPWISEVPYLGALFRRVRYQRNEVELLILVTPELVEGMDAHEVPPFGPGMQTASPSDWELFMKGQIEVPNSWPGSVARQPLPGAVGVSEAVISSEEGMMIQPEMIPAPSPMASPAENSAPPDNRHAPAMPQNTKAESPPREPRTTGLIGPAGYDVW